RCRIDDTVSADTDLVVGIREVGHQELALVVGHDNLDEIREQILRLGDNPYTGFRAFLTLNHTLNNSGRHRNISLRLQERTAWVRTKSSDQGHQDDGKNQRPDTRSGSRIHTNSSSYIYVRCIYDQRRSIGAVGVCMQETDR